MKTAGHVKLRILLADDHAVMREGLRMIINAQGTMEVVGEAESGATALALARELKPDVLVMDLAMPEISGLEALERLAQTDAATRILVLTRHSDRTYVQRVLQAGARGYVLKRSASDDLVRAIYRVMAGQIYLDPAIADTVVSAVGWRSGSHGSSSTTLSQREEEILRLVAWGLLTKEIAARLQISIKTVETHKANAMSKLGLRSRVEIVRYALLQGWLRAT